MEEEDNIDFDNEEDTSSKQCNSRGTSTGLKAQKNPQPKTIMFNKKGNPMGEWAVEFITDVGVVARNVNINYDDWRKVPSGEKQTIWLDMQKKWNIKDESRRKSVLSAVGSCWKSFKSYLTSYYVYKTKKQRRKVQLDDPLSIYPMISKDDWEEFVRTRMHPDFKKKSEQARVAQKMNLHPHYLGRDTYDKKIIQWHKEEIEEEMAKAEADPNSDSDCTEEAIRARVTARLNDRGYVWIKGHNPLSRSPPPQTKELIDNINHWREKVETGEFVPSGKEDALVKATGKYDHPGRTRAV